jgi:two-component system, OmpR family, sensor histidine kinase KdpD
LAIASIDRSRESWWLPAARWLLVAALTTGALWLMRDTLDKAHMALAFLLVVLAASARHGRRLGFALAIVSFLCFNFFLLPPYHTFHVAEPLDWAVLATFLITGGVAAQLLYNAQRQALIARQRADEIDRLSVLGAETLNAGRAEDAIAAIAEVIKATLRLVRCEIWIYAPENNAFGCVARAQAGNVEPLPLVETLFGEVLEQGLLAAQRSDGTAVLTRHGLDGLGAALREHGDTLCLILPLRVRGRGVGVLRLVDRDPMHLDAGQERFAQVLSYYAALGVERVQLVADAERVQALREADRLREALLAGVSHDLRTPLTTIKGLAYEMRHIGDERTVLIEEEADRLNALVADLLDLSRLNAGVLPCRPEIVAAEDLIGAALRRVAGAQGAREIATVIEAADTIPVGRFDLGLSVRALVNLLENALKYSPPALPIELRLARSGGFLEFAVLDRGAGIGAAEAGRIFEAFHRSASAPPDVGGTGLGLTIARRLAEVQGGAVTYAPRSGGGSIFTLVLPAADIPELTGAAPSPE